jgi:hypothetical protein
MKITAFELEHYVSDTIAHKWRDGLAGGFGGTTRQTMLRVKTDSEIDGIVWLKNHAISQDLVERCLVRNFVGTDTLMREQLWSKTWELDRLEELPMYALGYVDVAAWISRQRPQIFHSTGYLADTSHEQEPMQAPSLWIPSMTIYVLRIVVWKNISGHQTARLGPDS